MRESFATWLDNPRNHEVALHLVRELIERYTALHFEDVLGAAAGPRRAEMGITHAADLLGEDGVKQTWGLQVKRLTWHPVLFIDSQTTTVHAHGSVCRSLTSVCVSCVSCVLCVLRVLCVLCASSVLRVLCVFVCACVWGAYVHVRVRFFLGYVHCF